MGRKKNKQRTKCSIHITKNEESPKNVESHSDKAHNSAVNDPNNTIISALNSKENITVVNNRTEADDDISFEKYRSSSERLMGREYFVHSLCQVCKEEMSDRVLCSKCRLVSYCSQGHLHQHWPIHADLCEAIVRVCADRQVDHIMQGSLDFTPDKFRMFRFQNMVDCENKVARPLDRWEREIFIFPNVCGTCYKYNVEDLVVCSRCRHSGFCEGHRMQNHDNWCEHLVRYKNIIKDQNKFGIVCPSIPNSKLSLVLPKLFNIEKAFKQVFNYIDVFEFLELTDITTYPFTALNALLMINSKPQSKLTLHVVGAESDFEINKLEKWEYYILHLIPELQQLEIEFIGPELNTTGKRKITKLCSKCTAAKKTMTLKFHNQLYHTFCQKPSFSKPDMICVFNPGLYRMTGFNNEDTWSPSIISMFAQNCPVLITAYTQKEILLDVQRVQQTQPISLDKEPTLNPFSSLKPSLNFVSDEDSPVIFKNQFYCIVCKV